DICINQAWSQISSCQESCKSKLFFFGDDTDYSLKCFDNDSNGGTLINNCFHTMKGYCAPTTSSYPQYIEKPTYQPKLDAGLKINEHEIVEAFKAFHVCAGRCMKDLIVECFEQQECGVSLGDTQDIGKIGEFCATLKGSIYTTSVKALPCLMPGLKRRDA
uniref:Chondroitin proteoglycan 4 domain-containing protein n=1 Tax=Panagrolaimus sp. ES5 TaxID=591445 RepID=A0AC34G9K0_9BILA